MIEFNRYPHVKDLLIFYSSKEGNVEIPSLIKNGITSENEANLLGHFVLHMIDEMAEDMQNGICVLGSKDNTTAIPDIDYEISLCFSNSGFEELWNKMCDEG